MKSSIVLAVLVSAIVWIALALVFRIIPASNQNGAVVVSLVAALAGGLFAIAIVKLVSKPAGFLSSVAARCLVVFIGTGLFFFVAGKIYKPARATITCHPASFQGNTGDATTNNYVYLDPGEHLTWHINGRAATHVKLVFTPKDNGKCPGIAPFESDTGLDFLMPADQTEKISGKVKAVAGCFGFTITCDSGSLHDVIDPMIEVPRPPRRLYGLPFPFGLN